MTLDALVAETASRIFAGHAAEGEDGAWPAVAWTVASTAGLPEALLPEAAGGVGLAAGLPIARLAGVHALALPLPEIMAARWLAAEAGLPQPIHPTVFVPGPLTLHGARVAGRLPRVPWGRCCGVLVPAMREGRAVLVRVPPQSPTLHATSIAGEPRDDLEIDAEVAEAVPVAPDWPDRLRRLGAALRSLQIAGALETVTTMTVSHARDRVQFGRPIGSFQAVQQLLAVLAGQSAAARAAADLAVEGVADGLDARAIAVAKARAGEAAGIGAAIAHQVHGAIGFAREHCLHRFTRRLWAWRDEYGGEAEWTAMLGRQLAAAGADRLWAELVRI